MGVTLLPYYTEFAVPVPLGLARGTVRYVVLFLAGFNGYLLLGHYLRTGRAGNSVASAFPCCQLGYAVTFLGFRRMTSRLILRMRMLELFTYCSLNVVMMTILMFMLCKRATSSFERIKKALANLTLSRGRSLYDTISLPDRA